MTSLYQALTAAGCEIDHHESDLYVKLTPAALAAIRTVSNFEELGQGKTFRSQIDGSLWVDFPFAYEPFWDARCSSPTQGA